MNESGGKLEGGGKKLAERKLSELTEAKVKKARNRKNRLEKSYQGNYQSQELWHRRDLRLQIVIMIILLYYLRGDKIYVGLWPARVCHKINYLFISSVWNGRATRAPKTPFI